MDIAAARALARALLDEHGLADWTIRIDRAKTRAGVCRPDRREIGLSGPMTLLHGPEEVRETILHEIAHALVGAHHGHGPVWQAQARALGASGARCLAPDAARPLGSWVGICPAGHEVRRHRSPRRVQTCSRCSRRFDLAHLFTWTRHGRPAPLSAPYLEELARLTRRGAPRPAGSPHAS